MARWHISMVSVLALSRSTTRLFGRQQLALYYCARQPTHQRYLFNLFRKSPKNVDQTPTLADTELFHPFSQSPFGDIKARGEAIKKIAPCPICAESYKHTKAIPCAVKFECPDCGWPTHCTGEHWEADKEHAKYCSRLREVNEDDHDLRRGRRMREFEMPGKSRFLC